MMSSRCNKLSASRDLMLLLQCYSTIISLVLFLLETCVTQNIPQDHGLTKIHNSMRVVRVVMGRAIESEAQQDIFQQWQRHSAVQVKIKHNEKQIDRNIEWSPVDCGRPAQE
jgi:hypothetical protein